MRYLIHVEKVWDEDVWFNLLEFIKTHECHLFLMPPQINYQKSVLGYNGTERELKKILKQRYLELKKLQDVLLFKVGLHIHISLFPEELKDDMKEGLFYDSFYFLEDTFKSIEGITFGWFKYDSCLERLCAKTGFFILHKGISFHDYDLPLRKSKLFEYWLRDKLRRIKLFLS